MGVKNYLRSPSISLIIALVEYQEELPFLMKPLQVGDDQCMVYYDIPEEKMQWALDKSAQEKLNVDDIVFDMYAGKKFKWKDAIIIRYKNANIVVSPYFVNSGATWISDVCKWFRGVESWGFPNIVS